MRTSPATRVATFALALLGCGGDLEVTPVYNHANGRVVLELNQDLDGNKIYTRVRRGSYHQLDCAKLVAEIEPLADSGTNIDGPFVDPALTKGVLRPRVGRKPPTPAMLAQLMKGVDSIIDVCVMDGSDVKIQLERDLFQAWDAGRREGIGGKADDPASGEQEINSAQAYGERCIAELGEIPFFEKTGDGTYSTYDCLESTEIPMTITDANGNVTKPQEGEVAKCDKPQYIYSLCEAGPRVAARTNDQGTRWVLLCRKSIGGLTSNQFNDIAMIGTNPFTGKTCFFQNALYSKTDGGHVPHPADKVKSTDLWSGVHGGLGSGIECAHCHDADPFIHSPWIDGAKDAQGRPTVPKMGCRSGPRAWRQRHAVRARQPRRSALADGEADRVRRGQRVLALPSHGLAACGRRNICRAWTAPIHRGRASRPDKFQRSGAQVLDAARQHAELQLGRRMDELRVLSRAQVHLELWRELDEPSLHLARRPDDARRWRRQR